MSVPKDKRVEGKLMVAERARGLAAYTLQITKNPKIFSPEQNDGFISEIRTLAINIYSDVWAANNVLVNSVADFDRRSSLQKRARDQCNQLLPLIGIAWKVFHLKLKRVKYWGAWVIEVRQRIQKWEDSDRLRFSQFATR